MSEFKALVTRLCDRMKPACETRDAWSVAEEIVPQIPESFRDKMAAEYLVWAFFRDDKDRELGQGRHAAATRPPRKRQRRSVVDLPRDEAARIESDFWTSVTKAVDRYTEAVRAEITAELLATSFALDDGTTVTWGDATALQHRSASMELQMNAAERLQQAARHEAAIEMLKDSGSPCLNQMQHAA